MTDLNLAGLPGRVDAAIARALDDQRLVGAVVLTAVGGQVVHQAVAGLADREAGRPMRDDTIFRLASLTKPLVTAAAMALIEQGLIGLDDPITRWLPDFRPKAPDGAEAVITVRHLLTHTSGLGYGFFQPDDGPYAQAGISDGLDQPGLSMDEELRRLGAAPLFTAPGQMWSYSLSLDVLGAVLAAAKGASLPQVVAQYVTEPLGLKDTGFAITDPARLAVAYADARPPRLMQDPDKVLLAVTGTHIRFAPSRIFDSGSFPSGGAGMAGTARDFLKFLETLRQGGGPILKPETVQAMMANQIGDLRVTVEPTPSWGFGFGGAVLLDPVLNGGPQGPGTFKWAGVYGHHWFIDPSRDLTVAALTNTALEGMAGEFVPDLAAAIYGA